MVRSSDTLGATVSLKQFAELFDAKPCVSDDTAKSKCVNGIVPRDGKDPRSVGHNDVLALTDHRKSRLFKSAHSIEMIDARNLWQG
jgi:hypothetical protein